MQKRSPRNSSRRKSHQKPIKRPRRRQKDRNAETRLKLVDAAGRTIYNLGYGRASIGEIVKTAGLTKGAHLHHFQTKEQLMAATIQHLFDKVRADQENAFAAESTTPQVIEARFEQAAERAFDWRFIALLEIWVATRTEPILHKAFVDYEAKHAAARRQWFSETYIEGAQLTPEIADILGGMNFMLRGLFLQQILSGEWRKNSTWIYWRRAIAKILADAMAHSRRDSHADPRTAATVK